MIARWAALILEAIVAVAKAIPVLDRLLRKPVEKTVEEAKDDVRDEMDHFHRTGRPK